MKQSKDTFSESLKSYIESWFDYHPEPWNIEIFEFPELLTGKSVAISVFTADQVLDTFMIKLTFATAKKAVQANDYIYELAKIMGLTMILLNRNLFLFTDRRF